MASKSNTKVKVGIYLCAILMMGAIAVSSNIANLTEHFSSINPNITQTTVLTLLITIPCLVVIPVTIICGKLMDYIPSKVLMIIGVLCWLIGGCVPYFMTSLTAMGVMRAIFGIGIGMVQTLCNAIAAENFTDEAERAKVLGSISSFQMLGGIFFSIVSGYMGTFSWNLPFLVHLMAVVSLIACIICIPYRKPVRVTSTGEKTKFHPTGMMWVWAIMFFVFLLAGQGYSNYASSIITELGLGNSVQAGYSLAIFCIGGFIMGFLFAKVQRACGRMTLTVGMLVLAVSYLFMTFAPNLVVSYIGAFICGLSYSICMPCIINGAANSVEPSSSAMAISIATCLQNAGMSVSQYVLTPLGATLALGAALTGNQGGMMIGLIIIVVMAIVFAFINMRQPKPEK